MALLSYVSHPAIAADSVFVLHAHEFSLAYIQIIRCTPVRRDIAFADLEANSRG